jgi:hypothetical protein
MLLNESPKRVLAQSTYARQRQWRAGDTDEAITEESLAREYSRCLDIIFLRHGRHA